MGILNKNGTQVPETVQARLAAHFLARLVHAARAAAIEQAVTDGLLTEAGHGETAEKGKKPKTKKDLAALLSIADFGDDGDGDFVGSGSPAPRGRCFQLGPKLAGLSRRQVVRVLKRSGVELDGASVTEADDTAATGRERRPADETERVLAADVVRASRAAAEPPNAADVATLYLLASAFSGCGPNVASCLAAIRMRQPIVSIVCPVEGFESTSSCS